MKGEINRDWYCALGRNKNKQKDICHNGCDYYKCEAYHRKWPTPIQFREEYDEDYPDFGAVYAVDDAAEWDISSYYYAKPYIKKYPVVCACTSWGKPPNDWRPE